MPASLPTDFDPAMLSDAWMVVTDSLEAEELEQELSRELSEEHVLLGRSAVAVAVRRLRKEAIFFMPEEGNWAVVHLTWAIESSSSWPSTTVASTWSAVVDELADRGRS